MSPWVSLIYAIIAFAFLAFSIWRVISWRRARAQREEWKQRGRKPD